MIVETFVSDGDNLHFNWSKRQFKLDLQAAVLSYQVVLVESDRGDDKRHAIRAEVERMAIHTDGSSGSFEVFCGGTNGNAELQPNPFSLRAAPIADKLPQVGHNRSSEFSHWSSARYKTSLALYACQGWPNLERGAQLTERVREVATAF